MIRLAGLKSVSLGPFNPHIITPSWLRDTEVIKDLAMESDTTASEEATQEVAFSTADLDWQVDGQSLSVESDRPERNCGDYLARVICLLPHTPVRAVVNEFFYAALPSEWGDGPFPQVGHRSASDYREAGLSAVRWAGLFDRRGARAELMLEADLNHDGAIGASLRYFRRIRTSKAKESSAEAERAAKQFLNDQTDAKELIWTVFGQKVTP